MQERPLIIPILGSINLGYHICSRLGGHLARMEEGRRTFKILTGKLTGKRHFGRPWRRWEDNIRMDLK